MENRMKKNFAVVQLFCLVQLFVTPWIAACQGCLSFTISQSMLKLISIDSLTHPTISFSVILFSSCLLSFPASVSYPVRQLTSSGQSIAASTSVLPMNIQGWFPLGLTSLILLPKGLSRIFSSTTQRHQFFRAQPSLWLNSHIHSWLLEKS